MPAIAAPLSFAAAKALGGATYLRRTMLISLAGMIFVLPFLLIAGALRLVRPVDAVALHLFVIGFLVYWFHLTLVTTSHHSHLRTIPASIPGEYRAPIGGPGRLGAVPTQCERKSSPRSPPT